MAITPYTEEDKKLLACLPKCRIWQSGTNAFIRVQTPWMTTRL
mgnify:CR=1 FL=1